MSPKTETGGADFAHWPTNLPQEAVLATIEEMVRRFSTTWVFGYFTEEDIAQDIRLFCLRGLSSYDGKRPLENFLHKHCKNRLINHQRDNYRKNDPPCLSCHRGNLCQKDELGRPCPCANYRTWFSLNEQKSCLVKMAQGHEEVFTEPCSREEDVECLWAREELLRKVNDSLPQSLRKDWLQVRAGVRLSDEKMTILRAKVKEILMEDAPIESKHGTPRLMPLKDNKNAQ